MPVSWVPHESQYGLVAFYHGLSPHFATETKNISTCYHFGHNQHSVLRSVEPLKILCEYDLLEIIREGVSEFKDGYGKELGFRIDDIYMSFLSHEAVYQY